MGAEHPRSFTRGDSFFSLSLTPMSIVNLAHGPLPVVCGLSLILISDFIPPLPRSDP